MYAQAGVTDQHCILLNIPVYDTIITNCNCTLSVMLLLGLGAKICGLGLATAKSNGLRRPTFA